MELDAASFPALANKSARKLTELSSWLGKHQISRQSVQLGVTKTFLRKEAHDMLEARRSRRLAAAARIVQSVMRGMPPRRRFLMTVQPNGQRIVRGWIGRTELGDTPGRSATPFRRPGTLFSKTIFKALRIYTPSSQAQGVLLIGLPSAHIQKHTPFNRHLVTLTQKTIDLEQYVTLQNRRG